MSDEMLIHDSGRVSLPVCLISSAFGMLGLFVSVAAITQQPFQAGFAALFSVFLLSIWTWRTRLYFSQSRRCIVRKWPSFGWFQHAISLESATSVYRHEVRMKTRAVSGIDYGLVVAGGQHHWLTRVSVTEAESFGSRLSQMLSLPEVAL